MAAVDLRRIFDKMKVSIHFFALILCLIFSLKGVFSVSVNPHYMPSFLEEFRSMKLEIMIRDLHKLSPDELVRIKKEIDELLHTDEE